MGNEEDGIRGGGFAPSGPPAGTLGPVSIPRPAGLATPTAIVRKVTRVKKDWDVKSPPMRTTPKIKVGGATLADVAKQLDKLAEWGEGGGALRTDRIPAGTSTSVEVQLRGNLVYRMPTWKEYAKRSAGVRAEWDKMIKKLGIHEKRHVEIAIEEGDRLAKDLVGKRIGKIAGMVTAANQRMAKRQQELDKQTLNGSKPKVKYGDVILDTSIT